MFNISFNFWAMEFQEKNIFRCTYWPLVDFAIQICQVFRIAATNEYYRFEFPDQIVKVLIWNLLSKSTTHNSLDFLWNVNVQIATVWFCTALQYEYYTGSWEGLKSGGTSICPTPLVKIGLTPGTPGTPGTNALKLQQLFMSYKEWMKYQYMCYLHILHTYVVVFKRRAKGQTKLLTCFTHPILSGSEAVSG